ncbi:MAG: hypothetical protein KGL39_09275 [Patescibacteria group bacterium]|nr:hypothetical protein [Patescibacteria group bacterium]
MFSLNKGCQDSNCKFIHVAGAAGAKGHAKEAARKEIEAKKTTIVCGKYNSTCAFGDSCKFVHAQGAAPGGPAPRPPPRAAKFNSTAVQTDEKTETRPAPSNNTVENKAVTDDYPAQFAARLRRLIGQELALVNAVNSAAGIVPVDVAEQLRMTRLVLGSAYAIDRDIAALLWAEPSVANVAKS